MLTEQKLTARAKLASRAARAKRNPDDPTAIAAVDDARRDYYATSLEEYIQRVVQEAPPLTDEQRCRLAALLRPTSRVGGPDAA